MLDFKIPTNLLLSLTTAPVLIGLLGTKALANLVQTVGQASEEIFRGDRLPVLDSPESAPQSQAE